MPSPLGDFRWLLAACCAWAAPVATLQADPLPKTLFLVSGSRTVTDHLVLDVPAGDSAAVTGKVMSNGEVLVFDGTGGMIVADFDAASAFDGPFTVSARVEVAAFQGYANLIRSAEPAGFGLRVHTHGCFAVNGGGAWNAVVSSPRSLKIATTQHVAVTVDGTAVTLYVDGEKAASGNLPKAPKASQHLELGSSGREAGGEITDVPNLRLSHVAVFAGVLTAEQVRALASGDPRPGP